jgi:hypothetical protein
MSDQLLDANQEQTEITTISDRELLRMLITKPIAAFTYIHKQQYEKFLFLFMILGGISSAG